jgi:peroxiredoxin
MLLWGALAALAASLGYFVAAIVGWRGPHRKRRLVHCVVLAALFPALVGVQQLLLYQVFLPSLGHKARQIVRQQHDEASFVNVGGAAPAFSIETDAGGQFALDELRGKVVVLNFFATWCGACLMELPHVQKMWDEYKGREDFVLLVVGREETAESVAAFRKQHGYSFPMAADPQRAVYARFAKEFIPRTYVISPEGKICFAACGYDEQEFAELQEELAKRLSAE